MATRKKIDWESIQDQYRAGQLSISEIARQHTITPGAIHNKAKRYGWSRDLTDKVRERVKAKLVTEDVTGHNADAIIESASDIGVAVIRTQRKDIAKLQSLEQSLLSELGDEENKPTKVHVSNYQGEVKLTPLLITVTDRASALQSLANVQHKRIQLQRQAFNLDDNKGGDNPLEDFFNEIQRRNQGLKIRED
ncbi:MAG: hypothetical protein PF441_11955 [Desulfuromusa sp.]|jgi:hypothetical protein|nr:hypothetical protein [Desulfuromusa sp.]